MFIGAPKIYGGGGLVAKSCPTPCNPMDFSLPSSSVPGISQARILEWIASQRGSRASFHERSFSGSPESLQGPFLENCPIILKLLGPGQKYIHSEKSKYSLKPPPSTRLE